MLLDARTYWACGLLKQYPLDKDILLLDTGRSGLPLFEKRRENLWLPKGLVVLTQFMRKYPVGILSCKWNHSQDGSIIWFGSTKPSVLKVLGFR